ncbi:MAG TPA: hypothetical protein VHS96_04750, partial [Bacteroidia bacterium]|nr:hypothetical protein [Bacteroidia bacterium]
NGKSYAMPPSIGGMVAAEYAAAEAQVKQLLTPGQMQGHKLNELVATICRPKKTLEQMKEADWDGDCRERFNSARVEATAKEFRCLSINIKMAVLKWFLDNLKAHQRTYKMLWDDKSDATPSAAGKALESFGFYKVLMDLAETQVFGDWEKTNFTTVTTIFTYLVNKRLSGIEQARLLRERERSQQHG